MLKIKVKPGCTIFHKNQKYTEGQELELSEKSALVHGQNVELVETFSKSKSTTENKLSSEPELTSEK